MKSTDKKEAAPTVGKPETIQTKKEISGDKQFDDAIDRMLKKPVYVAPTK